MKSHGRLLVRTWNVYLNPGGGKYHYWKSSMHDHVLHTLPISSHPILTITLWDGKLVPEDEVQYAHSHIISKWWLQDLHPGLVPLLSLAVLLSQIYSSSPVCFLQSPLSKHCNVSQRGVLYQVNFKRYYCVSTSRPSEINQWLFFGTSHVLGARGNIRDV